METDNKSENTLESVFAAELAELYERDQETRRDGPPTDPEVDVASTKRMKEIIAQIGWPTISKVGEESSNIAWLLVQHADHDPGFQAECLRLMKEVPPEDIDAKDIAYLEDRILVNQGQAQIYGTQLVITEGRYVVAPYKDDDEATVNLRRTEVGLQPLADYIADVTRRNPLRVSNTTN